MSLPSGSHLGEYEILAPLGAGGMGEVYRARDPRIGREVAIKILPDIVANDRDRLTRFEREARAAGALNHPNLLTIYGFGNHDGTPYLVSELLEGVTLRDRMSGAALPQRKAVDYALQIAAGLAAAHEKGIVHRDLKPENIFVTPDGRVKILDFGLAKVRAPSTAQTEAPTEALQTDAGVIVGTAGYMSPEQVRGERVDYRSDIFSFGAVLYEMLSGRRAFSASSSIDTLHAILHDEPPAISGTNPQVPPALDRIVRHCLEKSPEERFQSARDLAFDLQALSTDSGVLASGVAHRTHMRVSRGLAAILVAACIGGTAAATWLLTARPGRHPAPEFHRLTFRSGFLTGARFLPGQTSVVLSMQNGPTPELLAVTPGQPEVRSLSATGSHLLSVAANGELVILTNTHRVGFALIGTLARLPMGGAARQIANDIEWAEWVAGGDQLLVVRTVGGKGRIELPLGNVIYAASGWLSHPRLSPDGGSIAFIEHPNVNDDAGVVRIVDRMHHDRTLSTRFDSLQGLAWAPDGDEVFFTGSPTGASRSLYAVSLTGKQRLILSAPYALTLFDVNRDGRLLVGEANDRIALFVHREGEPDRDLSWFDHALVRDIAHDGDLVLFDETGEGGGPSYSVYVRRLDETPAVRLGDGVACGFSPDGRSALAVTANIPLPQLVSYPIGPGETRRLTNDQLFHFLAAWTPDGRRFVFVGHEKNRANRLYLQDSQSGALRALTGEGIGSQVPIVSPSGSRVIVRNALDNIELIATDGSPAVPLPLGRDQMPFAWSQDEKEIFFYGRDVNPAPLFKMTIATRKVEHWNDLHLPSTAFGSLNLRMSNDRKSFVYSASLNSGDLFLLDGVH